MQNAIRMECAVQEWWPSITQDRAPGEQKPSHTAQDLAPTTESSVGHGDSRTLRIQHGRLDLTHLVAQRCIVPRAR